jgi:hypothetical protein
MKIKNLGTPKFKFVSETPPRKHTQLLVMEVNNELKLWIAAAFGDQDAIREARANLTGQHADISAAMVAAANAQTQTVELLQSQYPNATQTTQYEWVWFKATHSLYEGQVVLPVNHPQI